MVIFTSIGEWQDKQKWKCKSSKRKEHFSCKTASYGSGFPADPKQYGYSNVGGRNIDG